MTLNHILLTLGLLVGSAVAFLSFAPPQTGKWVYIWQGYDFSGPDGYYPSCATGISDPYLGPVEVPSVFSGQWNSWDRNGDLIARHTLSKGVPVGKGYFYSRDGLIGSVEEYTNGIAVNKKTFHANGQVAIWFDYENTPKSDHRYHTLVKHYDATGSLVGIEMICTDAAESFHIYDPPNLIDRRAEFGISP